MVGIYSMDSVGKSKYRVHFDNGVVCILYRQDLRTYKIDAQTDIPEEVFNCLIGDTLTKRATKRAMHLLEQMDRTEQKLREKLQASEYPQVCIDEAIAYVKSYKYLDDTRYTDTYVRYHGQQMSSGQMRQKLMQRGIKRDTIEQVLEEQADNFDELTQIESLLCKKNYDAETCDQKTFHRMYQFLMRRGYKSSDILKAMKYRE